MKLLYTKETSTYTEYTLEGWWKAYTVYYIKYTTESEVSGYYYENGKHLSNKQVCKLLDAIAEAKARKFINEYT